jgi:hypothetical protein
MSTHRLPRGRAVLLVEDLNLLQRATMLREKLLRCMINSRIPANIAKQLLSKETNLKILICYFRPEVRNKHFHPCTRCGDASDSSQKFA